MMMDRASITTRLGWAGIMVRNDDPGQLNLHEKDK